MFESIKSWITPPSFADEDQNREARYLHTILLTSMLLVAVYVGFNIALGGSLFSSSNRILSLLTVLMGILLVGLHRGYVRQGSVILVCVVWVGLTFLAWDADGIRDTAYLAHVVGILISSLLLGWRAAAIVTFMTILAGMFLAYAETNNWVNVSFDQPGELAIELSIIFILTAILIRLLVISLSDALKKSQLSNQQLQALSNDLETQIMERTQAAEIARQQAEAAQREAETARRLIESQMWFSNGQAELNAQLRGEQDVVTLAQQVIQQLCRYLDVPMGAIFAREGAQLYLRGSYAYTPTQKTKSFHFGEGLVGEVAANQRVLLVNNVPPGYLHLATSTGNLAPQQLFLHPLIYQGEVVGVVEMATFKPWTPRQSGFLNSVAESIAIAFHTAQTRGRIDELLMETQQQAEELQAQEEELRAANEEWEVQTESLRSSVITWQQEKARLEATIAELKKQNALLSR